MFKSIVRIRVIGENGELSHAFGLGTAQLLRGIKELSSLNKAAHAMGMAYSKAWKSINFVEECLGFTLIERNGARGSELTEAGEKFLAMYDKMQDAAEEAAERVLAEEQGIE